MEENKDDMPVEGATEEEAKPEVEAAEAAVAEAQIAEAAETPSEEVVASETAPVARAHRRLEKIGLVTSDKMQKTVVVRVERQVQHPKYRRYIRRRSKFMAHDELGAQIGDTVRIVETRPMSARKRWRVAEIIQRAR